MTELNNSLTAIDWLAGLNGAASNKCFSWLDNNDADVHVLPDSSTSITTDQKPPYSYANLITYAITSSPAGKMTLSEIYQWISDKFTYYKTTNSGWKNSVRHNLSLNKCFKKVARSKEDPGKGSYWAIDINAGQSEQIKRKKVHFTRMNNGVYRHQKKQNSFVIRDQPFQPNCSTLLYQSHGSNDSLNLIGLNSPPSMPLLSPDSSSSSACLKQVLADARSQSDFPHNTLEQVIQQSGILQVESPPAYDRDLDMCISHDDFEGEVDENYRRKSVDNITMKECDMRLFDSITTDQIQQYIDSCHAYAPSEDDELQSRDETNCIDDNRSPVEAMFDVDCSTSENTQHNMTAIESPKSDPCMFSNLPKDPLLSANLDFIFPIKEEQLNTVSTSGYEACSPQSINSNEDIFQVSTSSEKLVNKHGSGGTVTILKKLSDSCSSFQESFSKMFTFGSLRNSADINSSCDDPFDKFASSPLNQMQSNSSSFEIYPGMSYQSDDDEIVDNFNWDSIL